MKLTFDIWGGGAIRVYLPQIEEFKPKNGVATGGNERDGRSEDQGVPEGHRGRPRLEGDHLGRECLCVPAHDFSPPPCSRRMARKGLFRLAQTASWLPTESRASAGEGSHRGGCGVAVALSEPLPHLTPICTLHFFCHRHTLLSPLTLLHSARLPRIFNAREGSRRRWMVDDSPSVEQRGQGAGVGWVGWGGGHRGLASWMGS